MGVKSVLYLCMYVHIASWYLCYVVQTITVPNHELMAMQDKLKVCMIGNQMSYSHHLLLGDKETGKILLLIFCRFMHKNTVW